MISENITIVLQNISNAAKKTGRADTAITLIAVSKTFPAENIIEASRVGQKHFGENRIQESKEKIPLVNAEVDAKAVWHFIGHLQSNKAKIAVQLFDVIHSVDSIKLARALDRHCGDLKKTLDIFLQVNVGREKVKNGVTPEEAPGAVKEIKQLKNIKLIGLMTIPPFSTDTENTRGFYKKLRELKESINAELGTNTLTELSMGMSNDYEVAIQEGATYIRVGSAIFGERKRNLLH